MSRWILAPVLALFAATALADHYLVLEVDRHDVVSLWSNDDVAITTTVTPRSDTVDITLRDAHGADIYTTSVHVDRYLRAELDANGRWLPLEKAQFVVRVPSRGATLEARVRGSHRVSRFDVREPRNRIATNAVSPNNRIDLLIMGDGYTAEQESKFRADAERVAGEFFSIAPYSTYRNYVNVLTHFVASAQAGADHPVCSDGGNDPDEGKIVDTAFDATFCTAGIQRLLTVNTGKVLTAAAAVPQWDAILVIVNDPLYGGAGGGVSVASTHKEAVGVAQHEYGHSFTRLADEYTSPYPGYPPCSDISGPPCEPNVTDQPQRAAIKWLPWIAAATPIPTPGGAAGVGLFAGARYKDSGYYRPKHNCLMNSLGEPFCEVCAQTYVLRLYESVSMLDAVTPPAGAVTTKIGQAVQFQATLLQPVGGATLTTQWLVDGELASNSSSFAFTPTRSGTRTIELRVTDPTTLVHGAMAGTSLRTSRTWTINVSADAVPANFLAEMTPSGAALRWDARTGATGYEIMRGTSTIATVTSTTHVDATASPNDAHIYKVRAITANGPTSYSTPDWATPLAHDLPSLRYAANAARAAAGLAPATFTSSPATSGRRFARSIRELQTAINEGRVAAGMSAFAFTAIELRDLTPQVEMGELHAALK